MELFCQYPTEAATVRATFERNGYTFETAPDDADGSIKYVGTLQNVEFDQCPLCGSFRPADDAVSTLDREVIIHQAKPAID